MPKYGDETQKKLENYLVGYTIPKGKTNTGITAPYHDLKRNHDTMKKRN